MSDPKRLLDGAGGAMAMDLLAAGREEQPSDAVLRRTLQSVTLAAGAAATLSRSTLETAQAASEVSHGALQSPAATSGSTATGAGAVGGGVQSAALTGAAKLGISSAVLSKWVGIAAIGVGVSSAAPAAWRWLELPAAPPPATPAVRALPVNTPVQATPPLPTPQPPPAADVELKLVPAARPRALPDRPPARAKARSALDELRLVDGAREALLSGDAARALDVLEHYEDSITQPQFALEVAVLRMNALDRLGRTDAARRQARELLTRPLPEAQAARARAIAERRSPIK